MPTAISQPSILTEAPRTSAVFPAWFASTQEAAWTSFQQTAAPKRGDEPWRFSSLKELDFSATTRAEFLGEASELIQRSKGLEQFSAKFVFVNDGFALAINHLPKGVICMPLAEALLSHSELVEQYFMRHPATLGSKKFTDLHTAHLSNGMFIHVPAGVVVEHPIEIFHWVQGQHQATFPHTLIVAGEKAQVRVIETFQSINERDATWTIAVNDLIAEKGANLQYSVVQALNAESKIISVNASEISASAVATSFQLHTGAAWARSESICRLLGEESRSYMFAVSVPSHEQEYDLRTFQHHVSPGAYSDLLYKNSLYDESRTIFSGLIFVDEGAHRTDAYQTCRNLLMSNACEANSMPGLEINADDVKCSHGSTSSQISEEEIFYLRARGIHSDTARQLIARGFSIEVISRLDHEASEAYILRMLDEKFATLKS
jgi:Fe-S cluster assembly protein SufD